MIPWTRLPGPKPGVVSDTLAAMYSFLPAGLSDYHIAELLSAVILWNRGKPRVRRNVGLRAQARNQSLPPGPCASQVRLTQTRCCQALAPPLVS